MRAEVEHKAEKGVVRIALLANPIDPPGTVQMTHLAITGDFFFHPEDKLPALEAALQGMSFTLSNPQESFTALEQTITTFYQTEEIVSPGLRPRDFVEAIIKAISSLKN